MQQCIYCGKQFQRAGTICPNCGSTRLTSIPFPHTALAGEQDVVYKSPPQAQEMDIFTHIDHTAKAQLPFQQTQTPTYQPAPHTHPPIKSARILPKSAIVAAALATLLLVLSGVTLIYYAAILHPAQLRSTAAIKTTITAQAQANAVGTARSQATAQVQATASALQNIYSTATRGTPTLSSSLAAQTTMNWDTYAAQGGGSCTFTGNALHASISQKGYYIPCFAQKIQLANFALEVQANILQGDEGGIIFRGNDKNGTFYTFRITQVGDYSLDLHTSNNNSTNLSTARSKAIQAHQPNILTLVARENNLYFYINKQPIATISDSTYSTGKIGLFAVDKEHATDVAFSNIRIWSL